MAYTIAWNEASPLGSDPANTLHTIIQNKQIATRERLAGIFGLSSGEWAADPIAPKTLTLSGTLTSARLILPTFNVPTATYSVRTFNGGGGNDTFQFGYNLSNTLYVPQLNTEPQLWWGFESNWPNGLAGDGAFGTDATMEAYLRFSPIGNNLPSGYLEALFFNFDRVVNKVIRCDIRSEHTTLGSTGDGTFVEYLKLLRTGATFSLPVIINNTGTSTLAMNDAEAIAILTSTTGTNSSRLRFVNTGATVEIGIERSAGNWMWSTAVTPYSFSITNRNTTPILIGHANPEITILNGGNTTFVGTVAATIATAAQPNITSLGTLNGITIAGSTILGTSTSVGWYLGTNATARWEITAGGHFAPFTDNLTDIGVSGTQRVRNIYLSGSLNGNVTGNVTGNLTGTVLTAAQANITSLGTLTSLSVSGTADHGTGHISAGTSTSVSTITTIYATVANSGALLIVFGNDGGGNQFVDLVMCGSSSTNVSTIAQHTIAGAPTTRTYSITSGLLKLTMSSGTYTIKTMPLYVV